MLEFHGDTQRQPKLIKRFPKRAPTRQFLVWLIWFAEILHGIDNVNADHMASPVLNLKQLTRVKLSNADAGAGRLGTISVDVEGGIAAY